MIGRKDLMLLQLHVAFILSFYLVNNKSFFFFIKTVIACTAFLTPFARKVIYTVISESYIYIYNYSFMASEFLFEFNVNSTFSRKLN